MQCQTCGEELREGARFCPTCGTPTAAGGASVTPPTIQIRRPSASAPGAPTDSAPPELNAEEQSTARGEPPRLPRDPGAGYDPVGPPRVAPGVRRTRVTPAPAGASAGGTPLVTPTSADFNTLFQRIGRLVRLDTSVFGEVYADRSATIPVAVYAAVVFLISGLGGLIYIASRFEFDVYDELLDRHSAAEFFLLSVILGTVFALVMWAAWSFITTFLLNQLGRANADLLGVARVIGLALGPLVLAILLFFDDGFLSISWIALGAVVTLAVIGILEAIDVRPGHAWLATLAGFAVFVIVLEFLGYSGRDLAPGFFAAP
jgi:hypothetical protein